MDRQTDANGQGTTLYAGPQPGRAHKQPEKPEFIAVIATVPDLWLQCIAYTSNQCCHQTNVYRRIYFNLLIRLFSRLAYIQIMWYSLSKLVDFARTTIFLCFQPTVLSTVALMLQGCVRPSVSLYRMARRCVLEQKLLLILLIAYRKSCMRNRMVTKRMTSIFVQRSYQGHVNHCVTFAVEYLGNRQRQTLGSKGPAIGNGILGIKWSRYR